MIGVMRSPDFEEKAISGSQKKITKIQPFWLTKYQHLKNGSDWQTCGPNRWPLCRGEIGILAHQNIFELGAKKGRGGKVAWPRSQTTMVRRKTDARKRGVRSVEPNQCTSIWSLKSRRKTVVCFFPKKNPPHWPERNKSQECDKNAVGFSPTNFGAILSVDPFSCSVYLFSSFCSSFLPWPVCNRLYFPLIPI